jgi:hypothetical protein
MQDEPAARDRQIEAGLVFCRRAFVLAEERPVDQLDENRPSRAGSIELAISISLRAAASGLA